MSAFESAWSVVKEYIPGFMEPHDPEAEKEAAIQRIMDSIRFYTSPIDPETRKGGVPPFCRKHCAVSACEGERDDRI